LYCKLENCSKDVDLIKKRPDQIWTKSVLWIRIWKFWLDPNQTKKFGFGYRFRSRHCCRMKNRSSNTWKRKKLCFSIGKFFFSDIQVPEHMKAIRGAVLGFEKIGVKILVKKNFSLVY
jgi:predicted transcriptional regulator